jgi:hypothetical protein
LSVLLCSLPSPALSDFTHTPGKSSVVVLQGEVTVDGQQRPDLGRSFADTITGGLLKTKAYVVLDHLGNRPVATAVENAPSLAPEQSAVAIGKGMGARWIFVPRMIVEGDFNKLTLKRIRVSDGQVVDVFETHSSGDRSTMFLLVGEALKDIYTKTARDPARLGKTSTGEPLPLPDRLDLDPTPIPGSYRKDPAPRDQDPAATEPDTIVATEVASRDSQGVPSGLKLEDGTHVPASESEPKAEAVAEEAGTAKIKDHATETKDQFARYMGTISSINPDWRFCILKLRTSKELKISDLLSVKTGSIVPSQATLTITKIEGHQAVADLVEDAELETLKVGQAFYQWTPK